MLTVDRFVSSLWRPKGLRDVSISAGRFSRSDSSSQHQLSKHSSGSNRRVLLSIALEIGTREAREARKATQVISMKVNSGHMFFFRSRQQKGTNALLIHLHKKTKLSKC